MGSSRALITRIPLTSLWAWWRVQVHGLKAKSEKEYLQRMKDQVSGAGCGMQALLAGSRNQVQQWGGWGRRMTRRAKRSTSWAKDSMAVQFVPVCTLYC